MSVSLVRSGRALAEPHHDGSGLYVLQAPEEPGQDAVVRIRVPRESDVQLVALRTVRDGEPLVVPAERDEETESDTWWRASFKVTGDRAHYRWLLDRGAAGPAWTNGTGLHTTDVPDGEDFVLSTGARGPEWHLRSVVYEIFPDRFARSGAQHEPPDWAVPRDWDELPTGRGPTTSREWFGGDLGGIEQRLDYVERVGANVLYLTPIFPAASTHRYDASSFARVDPLLGGDEALASLLRAAHARDMRVVGDLTLNHCGRLHEWFAEARRDAGSPERELFYFDSSLPTGYACWLGVPSLPKFNWSSPDLRRRMLGVVRQWLDEGLDGWRIDVANMVARYGVYDGNAGVARAVRAVADELGGRLVLAEHGHDFRADLRAGGWHGAMNYSGFLRPTWWWLRRDGELHDVFSDAPAPAYSGEDAVAVMRAYRAGVPWDSVMHSWTLLDSHDTPRFGWITGSRGRQAVGIGLQMTTPGVPMLFAGDEVDLGGEWGEDARRPMPWARIDRGDVPLLADIRALARLRRSSEALAVGGIRYLHIGSNAIAYLRETRQERLLCLASRAQHQPIAVPFTQLETLYGGDAVDGVLPSDGPAFHVWRIIDG